jgi:hypothetical protein
VKTHLKGKKLDLAQLGKAIVDSATSESEKNPAAVALGRLGGLKGGKARDAALSKRRKSAIAKKAAAARWKKRRPR